TRRAMLVGGAGAVLLTACGGGKGSAQSTTSQAPTASLLAFFPLHDYLTVGAPQRLAFGIATAGGTLDTDTPAELTLKLVGPGGDQATVTSAAHNRDLPWSYYPMTHTFTSAGSHTVSAEV